MGGGWVWESGELGTGEVVAVHGDEDGGGGGVGVKGGMAGVEAGGKVGGEGGFS